MPYLPFVFLISFLFIKKNRLEVTSLIFFTLFASLRLFDFSSLEKRLFQENKTELAENSLCIVSANLLTQNPTPEEAVKELEAMLCVDKPNVVLAIEVNEDWIKGPLKTLETRLPLVSAKPLNNNFGMAVYSNISLEEFRWLNLGSDLEFPAFHAYVPKGTKVISMYGVHIMPPLSYKKSQMGKENRKKFFEVFDKDRSESKIVAGDFNATPGSWALNEFRERDLKLASNGHYLNYTWKMPMMPWAWFDHILLSKDLSAARVETSKEFGSDHRMIKAVIEW